MTYRIIQTGSKGNAVIIEEKILVDCGVSFKKLKDYYKKLKIVLLTHIHSDHFNPTTIKKLAYEKPTIRFACCKWLVEELVNLGINKKNIDVLEIGKFYDYKDFKISPILLYHNVEQCGYRIFIKKIGKIQKLIYATDTNSLDGIEAKNYDMYMLEANYEEEEIKNRIEEKRNNNEYCYEYDAMLNHLSKEKCDKFLYENMGNKSKYIYMHQHERRNENV